MSGKRCRGCGRIDGRRPPPFTGKGARLIDAGIQREVRVLWENGIETTESCEGDWRWSPGRGRHSFPEPTITFAGGPAEGFRALGIALQHGLKVVALRRVWTVNDGEPTGPEWEMTFWRPARGRRGAESTSLRDRAARSPCRAACRRSLAAD